jgi:monoterpene epsilon-lactone hydrolase
MLRLRMAIVISDKARQFFDMLKNAPKQVEMPIDRRRQAGEHAEDATSEPVGVTFASTAEVDGLWAMPAVSAPRATILYLFGGGYMLGSPASRRKTAGHIALAASGRVLVPNYRLAPEHPFPAAVDDAVHAYQGLLDSNTRPADIFIVGDSAGGGLAIALLIAARDRGLPMPAGAIALSPWGDLTCSGESMVSRAAFDLECTRPALLEMARWYMKDGDPRQPLASPIFADLDGLPPLLCIVGSDETLLDDSVRLVRSAGIAGVAATLYVAPGMQHVFPIWAGAFPEADKAIALIGSWIGARVPAAST